MCHKPILVLDVRNYLRGMCLLYSGWSSQSFGNGSRKIDLA